MKRTYVGVLFTLFLAGSTAFAQTTMRRDSTRDDSQRFRASATTSRGSSPSDRGRFAQRAVGERRTLSPRRVVDNRRFDARGRDRDHEADVRCGRRDSIVVFVVAPVYVPVLSDSVCADQTLQSYYQPGYEWGASLRQYSVDWNQFVPYLEEYIVPAMPAAQDAFRRGFIKAFGGNAEALYDRAMKQASQQG